MPREITAHLLEGLPALVWKWVRAVVTPQVLIMGGFILIGLILSMKPTLKSASSISYTPTPSPNFNFEVDPETGEIFNIRYTYGQGE